MTFELRRINGQCWEIPLQDEMKVRALVYADHKLLQSMQGDKTLEQLRNVAGLPGLAGPVLAMPDAHQGYGVPIGGVAAFDPGQGVIPPGGVGYDINCGVRLLATKLEAKDLGSGPGSRLEKLADALALEIPAGVGVGGRVNAGGGELDKILSRGAAWALAQGMGRDSDLEFCEAGGRLSGAEPRAVSQRARKRGKGQVGTLGAGNHFLELARVDEIYDPQAGQAFGLELDQLVIWVHSGSRGLGHQVCDDYLRDFAKSPEALHSPDRQLVAAPPDSAVGRSYLGAMAAAANYAFANRQVLAHLAVEAMQVCLGLGPASLGARLAYDLAHNIAKLEKHIINGELRNLWVLRKGATRALGPGHEELPARYRGVGQPVLLPGDMGRASFVLKGSQTAQEQSFASSAHGAGRRMSRNQAKKQAQNRNLLQELAANGVLVRARSPRTLAEEMPEAYKDASQVVEVMDKSGLAPKVARTRPLAVIKG